MGVDRIFYGVSRGPSVKEMTVLSLEMAKLESNLSLCLLKCGNAALALSAAEEAVKVRPSFAKAYARKGAALMALRRYGEAKECFGEASRRAGGREHEAKEYAALARRAGEELGGSK